LVERILLEARQDDNERLEVLAERFLRVRAKPGVDMTIDRDPGKPADMDQDLNPHRAEQQMRAREHAANVLAARGVLLVGTETDDELADLWSAVDRFESN